MTDGFDPIACQAYVESLVNLDEVERALLVLDNVPAYYRDNVPPNLAKLKAEILASLCTTHAYMVSALDTDLDPAVSPLWIDQTVRGQLVYREVKQYNEKGKVPHIIDVGPGEYHLPIGLKAKGCKFSYESIGVDEKAKAQAQPYLQDLKLDKTESTWDRPIIFVALEIIEHLPSTQDLVIECLRYAQRWPERIHLSTPCYTYDTKPKHWRKPCGLPHLRAYTPHEFSQEAHRLFPGYRWEHYPAQLTSLRGVRADTIDDGIFNLGETNGNTER